VKKFLTFLVFSLFTVAVCFAPVMAGGPKGCAKTCTGHEKGKGCGIPAKVCAAMKGGSAEGEEYKHLKGCCDYELDIKGMTCIGSENSITEALTKIDGVYAVLSISYKEGKAIVCANPEKVKSELVIKTVSDLGYETVLAQVDEKEIKNKKADSEAK
jgi:copper chaperone CopZ